MFTVLRTYALTQNSWLSALVFILSNVQFVTNMVGCRLSLLSCHTEGGPGGLSFQRFWRSLPPCRVRGIRHTPSFLEATVRNILVIPPSSLTLTLGIAVRVILPSSLWNADVQVTVLIATRMSAIVADTLLIAVTMWKFRHEGVMKSKGEMKLIKSRGLVSVVLYNG